MNLKKIGKVFTSKFVETGLSSYKKIIYRAAVSQRLRNTAIEHFLVSYKCLLSTAVPKPNKISKPIFLRLICRNVSKATIILVISAYWLFFFLSDRLPA